jgi:hypothetical protein
MLSRLGGRLITSPLAFLLAGTIDISWVLTIYVRWRLGQRRARSRSG